MRQNLQISPDLFTFVKGSVMQIEKALINDRLRVSGVSWKFCVPTIYNFANFLKFAIFLKSSLPFKVLSFFMFINKTLQLNNLKSRIAMNVKISVFVICVEAIMYLLLCDLHDCSFKETF